MDTIKGIFGIKTDAQKQAQAAAQQAADAQTRAARSSEEQAALQSATAVSGRQLRGLGRQQLAFMGSETGPTSQLASTLGG
jgi:hypothetical protein